MTAVVTPIGAKDVSITTATVEVAVMKLGGNKLTLAVFRQLPVKRLASLKVPVINGEVWGKVLYEVDSVGVHIVWTNGTGELFRAPIPHKDEYCHSDAETQRLLGYDFVALCVVGGMRFTVPETDTKVDKPSYHTFSLNGFSVQWRNPWDRIGVEELRKHGLKLARHITAGALETQLVAKHKEVSRRRDAWEKLCAEMEETRQLFIAV